ncbi:PHD finger domain protein [Mucor ambiguus]|uniref:Transcription factor BYE1 n=1 Tax=Mucor ambiguus TaxID=91626 RepID=A0A0C9M7I3_9FUNG|nr:PHD finger domain protein [Mucor ambiguus]
MNIDEYLDLQDQTETNLLSTEDATSGQEEQEHEIEWHSATPTTLNTNNFSNDWGLLQQNGFEGLEGINLTDLIAAGSAATAGMDAATAAALVSNVNHFITPGSLMKQPPPAPATTPTVTAAEEPSQQQEQKRVTRSRSKPAVPSPPKKKRATRAKKLYCTCQRPYDGEPMVQCDTCEEWFHCSCVGFNPDNQEEDEENIDWVCSKCKEGAKEPKAAEITVKEEKPTSTRQTRTRAQSKCLYSGCSNRTRKDSFCSDVCARKQSEPETPAARPTRRTSAMRTSVQSMASSASKEKKNNGKQTEKVNIQQDEDGSDADKASKPDQEEEFQAEDDQEEEEEEEAPQSATPDTPMSPSQMTEEENPVRRNVIKNMKTVLKSIFDVALTETADMMDESTLTTDERAEALAKSIENTMLEQLGDGGPGKKRRTCGEPYKSKFRSLLYNLKDKANKVFQIRVVTGDLTPDELVKMSSEDMANPELKSLSEVFREKGLKNSVMKIDNTPIIKKTHKGDIIMVPDKDNDNMYSEQVQQELDKINRRNSSSSSSPPTSTAISPTTTNAQADTDMSKKPVSSLSPNTSSTHQADPLDDILARIGIPAQDDNSHVSNKRSGSISDTTSAEHVDPEAKKRRVTLDVEQLLGDEDETFEVDEVDTAELEEEEEEQGDTAQEVQAQIQDESQAVLPTIWQGRVNMPQVAEFEASARQIGGRLLSEAEWDQVLSPTMWIEGRIPSERVTNYVTQTQYSTSREIVLLEVEAKGGDANQQGQFLLNYLDSRQRYAVVGHNKTKIRDFYLIPLYKVQHIPDCLYVVRVEETKRQCDLFLGVLVLTKHVPKPIVEQQPLYSPETLPPPQQQQQSSYQQQQQPYTPSSSSYQPSYGYNYNTTPQSSNHSPYGNYSSSSASSSSSYYRPY